MRERLDLEKDKRSGEVAQWLGTLTALPEDSILTPSTHVRQLQQICHRLLTSTGTTHVWHIHTHTHTHKDKKEELVARGPSRPGVAFQVLNMMAEPKAPRSFSVFTPLSLA